MYAGLENCFASKVSHWLEDDKCQKGNQCSSRCRTVAVADSGVKG